MVDGFPFRCYVARIDRPPRIVELTPAKSEQQKVLLNMQSITPNDYEIPADFPRADDDPIANYLRWQECVNAAAYVESLCFDAKVDAALGGNNEILDRAVSLVCGQNFTEDEERWIINSSGRKLGW